MAQHFLSKISSLFGSSSATTSISSNASRSMARERLSVILASQRGSEILQGVDMVNFQKDVMEVVRVRKQVVHSFQISLTLFLILASSSCLKKYHYHEKLTDRESDGKRLFFIMYTLLFGNPLQKHIKLAKSEPVSFHVKQEGDVNLFEMQVELDTVKIIPLPRQVMKGDS